MILVVGTSTKLGFPQHNLLGDGYSCIVGWASPTIWIVSNSDLDNYFTDLFSKSQYINLRDRWAMPTLLIRASGLTLLGYPYITAGYIAGGNHRRH